MTTSVVEVGTRPVLQLVVVAQAVVPPSQVVCAFPEKKKNCIVTHNINPRINMHDSFPLINTFIFLFILFVFPEKISLIHISA